MKIQDEYIVKIEKLTNLGYGLAKIDGFAVFVNNACPEDTLKIKITKILKSYAFADIIEIIEPSQHRIQPFCAMQKICGACQIQFIDYDYQLELKQQITKETLKSIGNIDIDVPKPISSPEIKEYRHKIQYPISETKNSKRILAGYYKPNSHEIVNIKHCPIQPKICDNIIEFIRNNAHKFNISGYLEDLHSGILKHVVIRHSAYNNKILVVLVVNQNKSTENLKHFANAIHNEFSDVIGVCANFNTQKSNVILGKKTECLCAEKHITEKILDKIFYIGAETFFQVNPRSAENIFKYVKNYVSTHFENPLILDAYAGISAFGICLSDVASKVVTIEENIKSVELAKKSITYNNITNIEVNSGDAEKFFAKEKRLFDVIVLDPPRKGCTLQSLNDTIRLCNNTIIYVSCNPATLARDLKILKDKGCTIESVQPFDMFCHTYHIENVAIIHVN